MKAVDNQARYLKGMGEQIDSIAESAIERALKRRPDLVGEVRSGTEASGSSRDGGAQGSTVGSDSVKDEGGSSSTSIDDALASLEDSPSLERPPKELDEFDLVKAGDEGASKPSPPPKRTRAPRKKAQPQAQASSSSTETSTETSSETS